MTNKSKARHGIRGSYRFKLNPTTRAIRNAFILGASLAMSGTALAGVCNVIDANTIECDGVFVGISELPVDDLTLILGGNFATVVFGGVDMHSVDGNLLLITDADVFGAAFTNAITVYSENGNAEVQNTGFVSAFYADGIYAGSFNGDATITNDGEVSSVAAFGADYTSKALHAYSYNGNAEITNNEGASASAVSLYGADATATAASAGSKYGNATVTNYGELEASSIDGYAYGASASTKYGEATVTNGDTGTVIATTHSYYGDAVGLAAASKYGNATVSNSGDVSASNTYSCSNYDYCAGNATGMAAGSTDGNAYAINDGNVSASTSSKYGVATGASAYSTNGNAYATNNEGGTIYADASGKYGTAIGLGAGSYDGNAFVDNYGSVEASTTGEYGVAIGGLAASENGDADITNGGSLSASATYTGTFYGDVLAIGASVGGYNASLTNLEGGSISGYAYAYYGDAKAMGVAVNGAYASATNDGTISASANVHEGDAYAYGAFVTGFESSLTNNQYGAISASAYAYIEDAEAFGSVVSGKYAATYNYGSITAYALVGYVDEEGNRSGGAGDAAATGSTTIGDASAYLYNPGDISATAINVIEDDANAIGAVVYSEFGYATTVNAGNSITAYAYTYSGSASAIGSVTVGYVANTINNANASISAHAVAHYGDATAIGTYTGGAFAVLDNYGDISATADVYLGDATAIGSYVYGGLAGTAFNEADSTITATATAYLGTATAFGLQTYTTYSAVYNYGDISATATGTGYGSKYGDDIIAVAQGVHAYGYFGSRVYNHGDISATASVGDSEYGYYYFYAAAVAVGVYNFAFNNGAGVYNYGDISATATAGDSGQAVAIGVYNSAYFLGPGITTNYADGNITATATAGELGVASATGIYNYSWLYSSIVDNYGSVSATATADYGSASATGVNVHHDTVFGYGAAYLNNYEGGDISATANAYEGSAQAVGSTVTSPFYAYTYNAGSISAVANADYGSAIALGSRTYGGYFAGVLSNYGDISAEANAFDGSAQATGSYAGSKYYAVTNNFASISAVANADYGSALAVGSRTYGSGYLDLGTYYVYYGSGYLNNFGDISAEANAYGGSATAIGADVEGKYGNYGNGYFAAQAYNAEGASISATAYGYDAVAIGVRVTSKYNAVVFNAGDITATATTHDSDYGSAAAIAVDMHSDGLNLLVNFGNIAAYGNGARVAVMSNDEAYAAIYNYGTMTGSIQTGNYNDYLYNGEGGTWNALQTSNFGYGDDAIYNYGTINMLGSTIDMGKYAEYGNVFYNYGTINVRGQATIDMGGNYGVEDFYTNPNPFYNGGVISWLDGAPNDLLTVVGDFAGHGDLVMDFNATTAVADHLYIEGDIIEPTVQRVSGALLAPPILPYTEINFAWVFGQSQAGDFTLGTISTPSDLFYTLNYGIVNHINVVGSTTDVYALGVTVSGLSPRGVMAASLSPGIQNLWHDGIGTVFQREGTVRDFEESGPALWLRAFSSDGSIQPGGADERNFGSGGSQDFDQRNSGLEFGFAFHFGEQWSAGVLLGKSDATIEPDTGGKGKIKADTYGAYLTWMPGTGFYGDLSYRHLSFDTDSTVPGGSFSADGDASGWSLEVGYAFEMASGWKIEPQLQVSDMSIDNFDVIGSTWGNFVLTDPDSVRTRLGVSLRKTYESSEDHSWTPYFSISAIHEDKGDNSFLIANTFHGESDLKGDSGLFEAGATIQSGAWTFFGGINYHTGSAFDGVFGGQIGARYAFGHHAPAPVVAPAPAAPPPEKTCADLDDDGDGVNNCNDKCPNSVAGQAIGPDGCPVPLTIDLKGVNFDFDKSTLRADAVVILDEAVAILTKYPDLKVEVAGHTDWVGTEEYNQGLSERRARAVYEYLTGHGIDAGRLIGPNGYGELKPIDTNETKEGRANNRRTELDVQN